MRACITQVTKTLIQPCLVLTLAGLVLHHSAAAQEDELDAGLLDLLNESEMSEEGKPDVKPEDIGLDEVGLEEASEDPVEAVRQSMLIAAEYLSQGFTSQDTQTLQNDIVTRLDELIEELEQGQNDPSSQNSEPQNSSSESQQQSQSQDASQNTTSASEAQDQQQEQSSNSEMNPQAGPGEAGPEATARVQLQDLRQLHEEVWGQLPERVRKQMQSQMVERFLPAYREQIEAYFEALMKGS